MDDYNEFYTELGTSVLADTCSTPTTGIRPLRSALLAGNHDYDYILGGMKMRPYMAANEPDCTYMDSPETGPHVWRIQVAIKIALPEEDTSLLSGYSGGSLFSWEPSSEFDNDTASWLAYFQEARGLTADGELDANTLRELDDALVSIRYYDIEKQKTIHNFSKSQHMGKHTVATSASPIREEPLGGATVLETMAVNDLIFITSLVGSGWAFVIGAGGNEGYVAISALWTNSEMPCSLAELYEIEEDDDEMLVLVEKFYKDDASEWSALGIDKRFFANMLLFVNNPGGGRTKTQYQLNTSTGKYETAVTVDTALYLKQETTWFGGTIATIFDTLGDIWGDDTTFDFENSTYADIESYWSTRAPAGTVWSDWSNVVLVTGKNIWVPNKEFAYTLLDIVNRGKHPGNLIGRTSEAISRVLDLTRRLLDQVWPIGMGYRLDGAIGATFGIPLAVDADFSFYVWRDSRDKIKVVRRGIIGGGLDAGIGWGGFVGIGRKDPEEVKQKDNWGIGAGLAGNIEAGIQLGLVQEIEFDLSSNAQILSIMFVCFGGEAAVLSFTPTAPLVGIALFLNTTLQLGLSPYDYTTLVRFTYAQHYEASGAGYLGIRFGNSNETDIWESWMEGSPLQHNLGGHWALRFLIHLLSLKGGASAGVTTCTGLVIRFQQSEDVVYTSASGTEYEETIYKDAPYFFSDYLTVEVYTEGQIFSTNGLNFFGAQLPSFLQNVALGMGVKATLRVDLGAMMSSIGSGTMPSLPDASFALYEIGGDLDIYNGVGHEHILEINPPSNWNNLSLSNLKSCLGAVSIFERINFAALSGTQYGIFKQHFRMGSVLIKDKFNVIPGPEIVGYVDYRYRLPALAVQDLIEAVIREIVRTKGWAIWDSIAYLWKFIWGTPHNPMPPLIRQIISFLHNNYQLTFHMEAGIGLGLAGKVAAGAKVRFQIMGAASLVFHFDVNEESLRLMESRLEDLYALMCVAWKLSRVSAASGTLIPMH